MQKPVPVRQSRPVEPTAPTSVVQNWQKTEPERDSAAAAGDSMFSSFTRRRKFSFF